ncbi:class I SAM-dependent methyltransferase [Candidatus Woesearchaeota archaeon]|nr:class I SAM-dependent methyltransferase [Candidatus Woesearchaeota archaeon]
MIKPEYLRRLGPERTTNHPCINCLLETEERIRADDFDSVGTGDKIWYKTYKAEIEELERVLRAYTPKRIIEVGSGSGRVIRTVLDVLPDVNIVGTEKNERTFQFVKNRFSGDGRLRVVQTDISDYLSNGGNYDMAVCLMNTFGNINDPEVFRKIVNHADYFVFSLYNRQFDEQRRTMYEARGHTNFSFDGTQYCFQDDWIKGLVSRSYTAEEIKELVRKSGAKLIELRPIELLYFAVARKK